jgi:hypothetical protein
MLVDVEKPLDQMQPVSGSEALNIIQEEGRYTRKIRILKNYKFIILCYLSFLDNLL